MAAVLLDGFVDDASALHGGSPAAPDPLVGAVLVRDVDLPSYLSSGRPLRVVSTGGAGALAGPLRLAARAEVPLAGLVATVRDLDDLVGNARRVVAALDAAEDEGLSLPDIAIEVPPEQAWSFEAALDVLAERELTLALRLPRAAPPLAVAAWLDAALDRETAYVVTAGLGDARAAVRLLVATQVAWDGGTPDDVAATLSDPLPGPLPDLPGARRWFRSFASADVDVVRAQLNGLGLTTPAERTG